MEEREGVKDREDSRHTTDDTTEPSSGHRFGQTRYTR